MSCRYRRRMVLRLALLLCVTSVFATGATGIGFRIEPNTVSVDESVEITLVLDGDLARLDLVDLPLSNLELSGPPVVRPEFSSEPDGSLTRRTTFVWWASPIEVGPASVGPLQLTSPNGERAFVPAMSVTVTPPEASPGGGAGSELKRLYLAGRDEVVLVAELEPRNAIVGQEVMVTWVLYSAVSLRGFAISSIPKLDAFWVEEDPVTNREPRRTRVGGHIVYKMDVRRASLFPLQAGRLEIPPLEVRVEVMRALRDPFGGYSALEGRVAEIRRRSASTNVIVSPKPVESDTVGTFRMTRTNPVVSPEGLITFDVTVDGEGTLRSTSAPRFTESVAAQVEVQEVDSDVIGRRPLRMRRVWRYVLFPQKSGDLSIPPLELRTLSPGAVRTQLLRTPVAVAEVRINEGGVESNSSSSSSSSFREGFEDERLLIGGGLVLLAIVLFFAFRGRRRSSSELEKIVAAGGHVTTLRKRIDEIASRRGRNPIALYSESSSLGDAWRAATSLVDRIDKEPESIDEPLLELRTRVERLLGEFDRKT